MFGTRRRPEFDVTLKDPSETVVAGFTQFGLAGLTAANYLTEQLDLKEVGHVAVDRLPAVTPFEDGTPRHHTRLFSKSDLELTVLVGELFVPPDVAGPFGESILEWTDEAGVEEVVVLSGVPMAHGPEDHRAFYVASEDFQKARLQGDHGVLAIGGGFLEGVNGELLQRSMDSPLRTSVLTTPVHPQAPEVEASLRLLEAFDVVYELGLDTDPLKEFAATVEQQYKELAACLEAQKEASVLTDRMYM